MQSVMRNFIHIDKNLTPKIRMYACVLDLICGLFTINCCYYFSRFLATGDAYTSDRSFRVGFMTISQIAREVCDTIWQKL